jgi:hypothetical protein
MSIFASLMKNLVLVWGIERASNTIFISKNLLCLVVTMKLSYDWMSYKQNVGILRMICKEVNLN